MASDTPILAGSLCFSEHPQPLTSALPRPTNFRSDALPSEPTPTSARPLDGSQAKLQDAREQGVLRQLCTSHPRRTPRSQGRHDECAQLRRELRVQCWTVGLCGVGLTVSEPSHRIGKLARRPVPVRSGPRQSRPRELTRADDAHPLPQGWTPQTSLDVGLREFLDLAGVHRGPERRSE